MTMIFLLRDDLIGEERLAALRDRLGSPDVQSLNVTVLDGQRLTVAELRGATEALPFLGDRRLVVVRRLFGGGGRADASSDGTPSRRGRADNDRETEFLAYFPTIPPTTDLILMEDRALSADHPASKLIAKLGGEVQTGGTPRWDEMARWIERRVQLKGGRIDRAAVEELSALRMDDLRQLDQVLESLVTYAGDGTISSADVRTLVHQSREVDVFGLVDAVGARDRRGALDTYRRLLADNVSPVYLLVMLTRQVRLLLLAQEALERRENLASSLKVHPRVAQKLAQQARGFDVDRCLAAFQRLAEVDQSIKTGEAEPELAVELLLVELTER